MYGPTIRRLREQKRMTQTELAERLGVGQSAVANMENGLVQFAGVEKLRRIAQALGVPMEALVNPTDGDEEPSAEPEPA